MGGQHTRTAIATGACATLGLALAVSLGVVPRATGGDADLAHLASIAQVGSNVLHSATAPSHTARHRAHHVTSVPAAHRARIRPAASTATVAVAPAVQTATSQSDAAEDVSANTAATTTTKQPAPKTPVTKKHPKKKHHKKAPPKKPATPKRAPRIKPSAAAVSSAITGLRQYVHTPFTPSASQVAEFGDDVCSAFDKNETLSHVEAVILQKVQSLPFTTVSAGAAAYVVKTAVHLYCPGYSSKLG